MSTIVLENDVSSKATGVRNTQAANRILSQMIEDTPGLKQEDKRSIYTSCNLFSDVPYDPRGWPDGGAERTVVAVLPMEHLFHQNPSTATAGWDLHCCFFPWLNETEFIPLTTRANNAGNFSMTTPYTFPLAGWTAKVTGEGLGAQWLNAGAPAYDPQSLMPDLSQFPGKIRVVGAAIEVRDVSKVQVKSGRVVAYRQATSNTRANFEFWETSDPTQVREYNCTARRFSPPPDNFEAAVSLPDKVEWSAFQGLYQHVRFNDAENPFSEGEYTAPLFAQPSAINTGDNDNGPAWIGHPNDSCSYTIGSQVYTKWATPANAYVPAHMSGFILAGLDPESKISVSVKYAIEFEPTSQNPTMCALSKPAAPRSSKCLALIDLAMQSLPVAVPVDENDAGDWFLDLAKTIFKKAGPIIGMIPHPIAQAVSQGMGIANNLLPESERKKAKRKKKEKAMPESHALVQRKLTNQPTRSIAAPHKNAPKRKT